MALSSEVGGKISVEAEDIAHRRIFGKPRSHGIQNEIVFTPVVGDALLDEEVTLPDPAHPDRPKKYRIVDYCTSALRGKSYTLEDKNGCTRVVSSEEVENQLFGR